MIEAQPSKFRKVCTNDCNEGKRSLVVSIAMSPKTGQDTPNTVNSSVPLASVKRINQSQFGIRTNHIGKSYFPTRFKPDFTQQASSDGSSSGSMTPFNQGMSRQMKSPYAPSGPSAPSAPAHICPILPALEPKITSVSSTLGIRNHFSQFHQGLQFIHSEVSMNRP